MSYAPFPALATALKKRPLTPSPSQQASPPYSPLTDSRIPAGLEPPAPGGQYGSRPETPQSPYESSAAPAAQQGPPASATAPGGLYSYDADPVLNQIAALGVKQREQATADANKQRQQLAVEYGDPDLAARYGDPALAAAAAQNPFSLTAQLAYDYQQQQRALDEALNKQNLFYSGERIQQSGELERERSSQAAAIANALRGQLSGIDTGLASAFASADQNDLQAQIDAYNRALQVAIATGGIEPVAAPELQPPTQPPAPALEPPPSAPLASPPPAPPSPGPPPPMPPPPQVVAPPPDLTTALMVQDAPVLPPPPPEVAPLLEGWNPATDEVPYWLSDEDLQSLLAYFSQARSY